MGGVADRLSAAGPVKGSGRMRVIYGRDSQSCRIGAEGERLVLLEIKALGRAGSQRFGVGG